MLSKVTNISKAIYANIFAVAKWIKQLALYKKSVKTDNGLAAYADVMNYLHTSGECYNAAGRSRVHPQLAERNGNLDD